MLSKVIKSAVPVLLIIQVGVAGQLVVDFNGTVSLVASRAADVIGSQTNIWNYSTGTALIDGPANGTSGTNLNTKIYGGVLTSASAGATPSVQLLANGRLQVSVGATTAPKFLEGIFLWNKADFLTNSAVAVSSGSDSFMSMHVTGWNTDLIEARFVVIQDGGVAWISSNSYTTTAGAAIDYTAVLTNFSGQAWSRVNDASLANGTYTWSTTFSSRVFTNITSVGMYVTATRSAASGTALFSMDDFKVSLSGTPPPPPASLNLCVISQMVFPSRFR